jgi:phage recombination protein Bet
MNSLAIRQATPAVIWHQNAKMMSLVKQTAGKDCNQVEFDQFVAVASALGLDPLRKQIYAFVFNKDIEDRRQMTLVVAIDGGRSIAARTGNYRPDNQPPEWTFSESLKNPLTNPHGIEKCTVGVWHRPTRNDPFERIVHTVYWDEFAPIVSRADEADYQWVGTGNFYGEGHKKAGNEIHKRQLRAGATTTTRLDPDKQQWIRAGRNQIAKCAEMGALRKGWPEDLSRVVVEEETHRAQVIEGEFTELTPSELAAEGETVARLEKLGKPAVFASFDEAGTLERIEIGKFADRVNDHTEKMSPEEVSVWWDRNRVALREFWAFNKTDSLELKKILEERSVIGKPPTYQADAHNGRPGQVILQP